MNLRNPINDFMVRDNKDFTELDEKVACRLCAMMNEMPDIEVEKTEENESSGEDY